VFTSGELSDLENACRGSTFAARRDAAIIAVFTATGIRLSELAGIRHNPGDPARSDLDLQAREIRIAEKAGKPRTVKIGHQAARSLDRYLRARARHPQACRSQLWLGVNSRGPLTATGIYQIIVRRGRQAGEDGSVAPIIGGLPASRVRPGISAPRWTSAARAWLPSWVAHQASPVARTHAAESRLAADRSRHDSAPAA
jgi:site-specific recombinase XerD